MLELTWNFSVGLDSLLIERNKMEFNYFMYLRS